MKLEPDTKDQKINPLFIIAYGAFLLIPCYAFFKGWQNHSPVAMVAAGVAILGFSFLLVVSIRHNRKIRRNQSS